MDILSIISAKREGLRLSREQIHHAVQGFTAGRIPDYQMSALLMAICLRGMDLRETVDLTEALVASGRKLDLSDVPGPKVDKHSTGGVGDKTTLVAAPIAAAAGVTVAKLSGRGLGHTGGTLDKLESVPGLRTILSPAAIVEQAGRIGLVVAGQSGEMVPADKKLYALRDVTGTVASIPLIAASVVSKKVAGGPDGVVLDVKAGSGAFMKTLDAARELAVCLVEVARGLGLKATALVSDMDQPLGRAVGNALEVAEAVDVLSGTGPDDVRELSIALAARMLAMAGEAGIEAAKRRATEVLDDGAARKKLAEMIEAQGGDAQAATEPDGFLPRAKFLSEVTSPSGGVVAAIEAEAVGCAARELGAGRMRAGDAVDPAAGITLERKVGQTVEKGEALAVLHTSREETLENAARLVEAAYSIQPEAPTGRPLLLDVIE